MTVPDERRNAVTSARMFLLDLLDPKVTPRVPSSVRRRAARILKHYPSDFDMQDVAGAFDPHEDHESKP